MKFAIEASTLTASIHIGRVDKSDTHFLEKEEATDQAVLAVAQYVIQHIGGEMEMTFTADDGSGKEVHINVKASEATR